MKRLLTRLGHWLKHLGVINKDKYHPERYYMRGPGPKYYAKHGARN